MKSKQVLCVVPGKVEMVVAHRTLPLPAMSWEFPIGTERCWPGAWDDAGKAEPSFLYVVCAVFSGFLVCFTVLQQLVFFYFFLQKFLNWTCELSQSCFQSWRSYLVLCLGMEAGGSYSAIL